MTPDVNVLVAAYRADHAHHDAAYAWLAEARRNCAQGSDTFTLLPMVATAFLRLVTNQRVFTEPDSIEDAIMPIRLTQVDTLGYDPAHVRLPSDSVSTSSFSDLTGDSGQWWVSTVCLRIPCDQMSLC